MNRDFLLIAQPFAPHSGSHATRINGLTEALLKRGHSVCVLTTTVHPGTPGVDVDLLRQVEGAAVRRAFCGPLHFASYVLNRKKGRTGNERPRGAQLRKSLMVPDTYVEWVPFGIVELLQLRYFSDFRPDVIISSAAPYSCHLLGLAAKRLFGTPWIADFGDPWLLEHSTSRGRVRTWIEARMESAVIQGADLITWTTNASCRAYQRIYPGKAKAMAVLPMGFRSADYLDLAEHPVTEDVTRLAYTGRVNPEHRDGNRLLDVFAELQKHGSFKLALAGTELGDLLHAVEARSLTNIEALGSLPHAQFVELLQRSDVLVLLGNRSSLQVPGKVFQYIGAKKPILYIKNRTETTSDEVEDILARANVPHFVVPLESPLDGAKIVEFISAARQGKLGSGSELHTWDARATELLALVENLIGNPTPIGNRAPSVLH